MVTDVENFPTVDALNVRKEDASTILIALGKGIVEKIDRENNASWFPNQRLSRLFNNHMFFEILTLFPSMFEGAFSDSIIKRAREKGLISINLVNFRDFTEDKHKTVDDYPYGGDPGMLIKPEPLARAIEASKDRLSGLRPKVVFLTPHGERLRHRIVEDPSSEKSLIFLCGRYKGVDQRILDRYMDREISIGDYVLSGGEIPAMALVDAITRLIPGVLGNSDSAEVDSFFNGLAESAAVYAAGRIRQRKSPRDPAIRAPRQY